MKPLSLIARLLGAAVLLLTIVAFGLAWSVAPVQSALPAAPALAVAAPLQIVQPTVAPTFTPLPAATATAVADAVVTLPPADPLLNTPTPTRTPSPVNLGNFVWDDLDGDGRQDAGEPGVAGVTVQLWTADKAQLLSSDITDANGNYTVVAPQPMSVRVRVVLPTVNDGFSPKDQASGDDTKDSDINPSGPNLGFTDVINIAANVISINNIDAGLMIFRTPTPTRTPSPVNLGNFVWDDLDGDGRQDAGEPGVAGVTVQLWTADKAQLLSSDITDANGNYTVVAPQPMSVRVRVVLPTVNDGFSPKDQASGDDTKDSDINPSGPDLGFTDVINIAANVISINNIDAGLMIFRTPTPTRTPSPVNLGNFVWSDLDEDGFQDPDEPGIEGVTVQLWDATKTTLIDETLTNQNGNYTVVAPQPMSVRLRYLLPPGASFAPKDNPNVPDTQDSDVNPGGSHAGYTDIINIAANVISISNIDAGILLPNQTPINIGNFVWGDSDGDGVQDVGERGVGGVRVQLWNSTRTLMLDEAITTRTGSYQLTAPGQGIYYVYVVRPASGAWYTVKDSRFALESTDSDINQLGNDAGFSDALRLLALQQTINTLDAGLVESPPLAVGTVGAPQVGAARGNLWLALALLGLALGGGLALRRERSRAGD